MSTKPGQKGSLWSCCSSGGSPSAQRGTAAGVFSAHGTGWWTENTAGAGHCNVLQCSSLCYTHPLLSILALPLTIAQSVAPLSLSPPSEPSRIYPACPSLSAFFLLFTPRRALLHALKRGWLLGEKARRPHLFIASLPPSIATFLSNSAAQAVFVAPFSHLNV